MVNFALKKEQTLKQKMTYTIWLHSIQWPHWMPMGWEYFNTTMQSYQLANSIQSTEITIKKNEHYFSVKYMLIWEDKYPHE